MEYGPTIADEIISHLLSGKSMYRQKKILWQRVKKRRNSSIQAFHQNIYRLSKKGYIKKKDNGYIVSDLGKTNYSNKHRLIRTRPKKDKKILVIFDIPEKKKKTREWLREQIRWWGFRMIQRSVWLGDGPLPLEFKKRLRGLGIDKMVLVFAIKSEKIN